MSWLEFVKVLVPLGWPIVIVIVTLLLKGEIFTFLRSILQRNFEFELPGGFVIKDGLVEISDFGRDFLIYLTTMRLSENKLW